MTRLLRACGLVFPALLLAVWGAALVLTQVFSQKVLVITPHPPEVVQMQKLLWQKGEPVAEIYGVPAGAEQQVVLPDVPRIVRPEEDPSLALYPIDKAAGENPLQEKSVWFAARFASLALAALAAASWAGLWLLRARRGP